MPMVPLCIPHGEEELAVIKSLLEAAGIAYIVLNDHFGAMIPGAIFAAVGPREVLVPAHLLDTARRLLIPRPSRRPPRARPARLPAGTASGFLRRLPPRLRSV